MLTEKVGEEGELIEEEISPWGEVRDLSSFKRDEEFVFFLLA